MPFLLAEILNFQGSTHRIGVGSFSKKVSQEYSKVSMLDGVLNAECIYLKTEGILLKAKGTWREWKNYFVRIINYCKLLDQLERRDRILQFWLR